MGDLMDQAIASLQRIAPEHRDEIASLIMEFVGGPQAMLDLSAADCAAIDEAELEFERGEIATDDEIRAIWAKHGLLRLFSPNVPRRTSMRSSPFSARAANPGWFEQAAVFKSCWRFYLNSRVWGPKLAIVKRVASSSHLIRT